MAPGARRGSPTRHDAVDERKHAGQTGEQRHDLRDETFASVSDAGRRRKGNDHECHAHEGRDQPSHYEEAVSTRLRILRIPLSQRS